jgi:DNA-damage-inducible protein J
MAKTAIIQARIDPQVKEKAQRILETLHISMSEAISLYLTQVTLQNGIPFELRIPNRVTISALEDAEKAKNLHSVNSVDELFKEMADENNLHKPIQKRLQKGGKAKKKS